MRTNERNRRLFADARYARNVVRGIPHQCFDIDKCFRRKAAIHLGDLSTVIYRCFLGGHIQNECRIRDELIGIAVTGHKIRTRFVVRQARQCA